MVIFVVLMQLFYTAYNDEDSFYLEDEQFRHCLKALRKKLGDTIYATDGKGHKLVGSISDIEKRRIRVSIEEKNIMPLPDYHLSIAIAPTKNMNRFEWFLEKATEIGVSEIFPLLTRYSERKILKIDRCKKILIAAMKQSQQFHLPRLHEMQAIETFLESTSEGEKFIAHVDYENSHLSIKYKNTKKAIILIGPEGDFSRAEIDLALSQNYTTVSLGKNRLRTETAGIVAAQIIAQLNE